VKRIPFVPFPLEKISTISKKFLWLSSRLVKVNPFLANSLVQAGIELKDREYLAIAIFSSLFWFSIIFLLFLSLTTLINKSFVYLSFVFSILISVIAFVYITFYPNFISSKKNRDIERNLLFAIRHLYIQIKSGVSLFDALVSVSKGNYGLVSEEFNKCTKEIATGKEEISALEELTFKIPNTDFKRVVWQIVNSLRAGGDIGNTLNVMSQNLSEEQKVKIRKYGSQLSPMALMYMMLTVILPTLGITFLIIFSTFSGIQLPETVFYMIMIVLAIFQVMFIGLIKSRRPSVGV
jgi:flagellar protein FlaJ